MPYSAFSLFARATLPFRHYLKTKDDNRIRLDSKLDFILNNEPTQD